MSKSGKQWEPTPETFDKLLLLLDADRELAGRAYQELQFKLITYFERRNCPVADELADEVLNRATRKLEAGEAIQDLSHYCYGIAKFVWQEYQRKMQRYGGSLDDLSPLPFIPQDFFDTKQFTIHLRRCLDSWTAQDRQLLLQYLCQDEMKNKEARKALAATLKVSPLALRLRVHRLKSRLADCLKERLNG